MTHTLYVLDQEGTALQERPEHDDAGSVFRAGGADLRRLCGDMKRLGMVRGDESGPGIPEELLTSHDGLVVSPLGVGQALDALRDADPGTVAEVRCRWDDDEENLFDAWVGFLERAADEGGIQAW